MLGAVLGNIIGSGYERTIVKAKDLPLRTTSTRYTDASVMTLAVAKWLLEDSVHNEQNLIKCMQKLGRAHIRAGYGDYLKDWLMSANPKPYNSCDNGSAMRVSPVGLYAESESEALLLAELTAKITHNHPDEIKGAKAVAMAVFINKSCASYSLELRKKQIKEYAEKHFGYNLNQTLDEIRSAYLLEKNYEPSVPEAIIAYLESESMEDCIRNAISIGGNSGTIAAIACSIFMAGENSKCEANAWTNNFEKYLSSDLKLIMSEFERVVFPDKPTYNSYKVTDWLWAGEYPGDRNEYTAKEKLLQYKRFGITHFVDLTEDGELKPYKHLLDAEIKYQRFPIIDQHIPNSTGSVRQLLDGMLKIHNEEQEAKFYIHCWGGVGRTGTIVGCFLGYYLNLDYDNAIEELKRLFEDCPKSASRISPENLNQFDFIKNFILKEKNG